MYAFDIATTDRAELYRELTAALDALTAVSASSRMRSPTWPMPPR
jgi:hypothetical protein